MMFQSYRFSFSMPPLNAWSTFLVRELENFFPVWDIVFQIQYSNVNEKSNAVKWLEKAEKRTEHLIKPLIPFPF